MVPRATGCSGHCAGWRSVCSSCSSPACSPSAPPKRRRASPRTFQRRRDEHQLRRRGIWKQVLSHTCPYFLVPVRHSVDLAGKAVSAKFSQQLVRDHGSQLDVVEHHRDHVDVIAKVTAYFLCVAAPGGGHEFLVKFRLPPVSAATSEYDVRFRIAANFTSRPRTSPALEQLMRDRASQDRLVAPRHIDLYLDWPVGSGRYYDAVLSDPVNVQTIAEHRAAAGMPVIQRIKKLAPGVHKHFFVLCQRHS